MSAEIFNQQSLSGHIGGSGGGAGPMAGSGNSGAGTTNPTHLSGMDLNQQAQGNIGPAAGTKGVKSLTEAMGSVVQAVSLEQFSQILSAPPTPFAGKIPGGIFSSKG